MDKQKYIIMGFSGAGKTYLLEMLIKEGRSGDDLDLLVINNKYSSSREMIKDQGLDIFRQLEFQNLKNWITQSAHQFLALGGGSITEKSLELINNSGAQVIYIDRSFDDCWQGLNARQDSYLNELGRDKAFELYIQRKKLFSRVNNSHVFNNSLEAFNYLMNR